MSTMYRSITWEHMGPLRTPYGQANPHLTRESGPQTAGNFGLECVVHACVPVAGSLDRACPACTTVGGDAVKPALDVHAADGVERARRERSTPRVAARMPDGQHRAHSEGCNEGLIVDLFQKILVLQYVNMKIWRMGWDSNPRDARAPAGFQDRCLRPLGHPSGAAVRGRWWARLGLNQRPPPCEDGALPLSYVPAAAAV